MKRIVSTLLLTLSLLSSSVGQAANPQNFADIEGHWAKNTIQWAVEAGIVKGYHDDTFKPNHMVTEAEFLTMLFQAFPASQKEQIKQPNHWADSIYQRAESYRYPVNGTQQLQLRNQQIKRQQVAEIIAAANGRGERGEEAILYVMDKKLASGKTKNPDPITAYQGDDLLTRAEAVQFISNAMNNGLKELKKPNQWSSPPAMMIDPENPYFAKLSTNKGDITLELFAKDAPQTVNNFVFLSKAGFYDQVIFHRVIKDFMIQTGDPTGTGAGGPGYRFKDELPSPYAYQKGVVAMANAGPDTNGSQFFICNGPDSEFLNRTPNYTVFGRVIDGMDVVDAISSVKVEVSKFGEMSKPTNEVYMKNVEIWSE